MRESGQAEGSDGASASTHLTLVQLTRGARSIALTGTGPVSFRPGIDRTINYIYAARYLKCLRDIPHDRLALLWRFLRRDRYTNITRHWPDKKQRWAHFLERTFKSGALFVD